MGRGNAAVKQWMSNRARFADLFHAVVFQGEQSFCPGSVKEIGFVRLLRWYYIMGRRLGMAVLTCMECLMEKNFFGKTEDYRSMYRIINKFGRTWKNGEF